MEFLSGTECCICGWAGSVERNTLPMGHSPRKVTLASLTSSPLNLSSCHSVALSCGQVKGRRWGGGVDFSVERSLLNSLWGPEESSMGAVPAPCGPVSPACLSPLSLGGLVFARLLALGSSAAEQQKGRRKRLGFRPGLQARGTGAR